MLKKTSWYRPLSTTGNRLPLVVLLCGLTLSMTGCGNFFTGNGSKTLKAEDGTTIDLNDETVKQYVEEWHNSKPSIDRLAKLETDLSFLLSEVSKMSDLGQVPGMAKTAAPANSSTQQPSTVAAPSNSSKTTSAALTSTGKPAIATTASATGAITSELPNTASTTSGSSTNTHNNQPIAVVTSIAPTTPSYSATAYPVGAVAPINSPGQFLCPEPFSNNYKKSIAFVGFPRMVPISSRLGALHQVEQHLPMLIGANLRNRHSMLTPTYLHESFANARALGEVNAAMQAQALSKQNRVQFFVSGEIDDMTMTFPDSVEKPNYYTRFINGVHNLLHINTPLDKRSRVFSFTLEVRDGFTGQIIFNNQYRTFGKWKASADTQMGFGSPRFWETDYGIQIQHLVAKASDDMATAINCQPYMARVDSTPGQQQIVVHSGTNNGMHSGDTLDLYQLVYQSITGEYQRFDTRLVKRKGRVYLTEIYPSHSVGHVVDETLLSGQYLVRAR